MRRYLELAKEQMDTLRRIIGSSLGVASSCRQRKTTDLVELTEAALRIHQRRIDANQIHLVKDLPGDLVANVHRGGMLQVISNLIVNALDTLPAQGTLHVRLRKSDALLVILIADTGHGIPNRHIDDVWRPFFTTKGEQGTGLGLALSERIVTRHQGRICMRSSVREGKSGTIFKITLPRQVPA